jgi:hypothetical protein
MTRPLALAVGMLAAAGCFNFDGIQENDAGSGTLTCGDPLRRPGSWEMVDLTSVDPGGALYTIVPGAPLMVAGIGNAAELSSTGSWQEVVIPQSMRGAFQGGLRDQKTGSVLLGFDAGMKPDTRAVLGKLIGTQYTFDDATPHDLLPSTNDSTVGVASNMNQLFLATTGGTAWTVPDLSSTWTTLPSSFPGPIRAIDGATDDAALCGYGFVARWDAVNNGWSTTGWSQQLDGSSNYDCKAIATVRYAATPSRFRVWVALTNGVACALKDPSKLWACRPTGLTGDTVPHLAASGCDPSVAIITGPNPGDIAISTDAGDSWRRDDSSSVPDEPLGAVYIDPDGTVFAVAKTQRHVWVRHSAP